MLTYSQVNSLKGEIIMKPIKVIFLDIDGVMNSWDEMRLLISTNEGKPIKDMDLPSKSHMSCLKNIVNKTKAKIVLASSWRISLRRIQTLIDIFEKYNLTIYGYTCEGVDKSELLNTRWRKVEGFKKLGWTGFNVPDTTFYLWLPIPPKYKTATDFANDLLEKVDLKNIIKNFIITMQFQNF